MEASRVIHERTQHVQIGLSASLRDRFTVFTYVMGASFTYRGEAAGHGSGVPLPTEGAFILGLSEPAQEVIAGQRSETGTVPPTLHQSSPSFATILTCVWDSMTKTPSCSHNILRLSRCTGPSGGCHMEETADPPLRSVSHSQGTIGGSGMSSHLHAVHQTWTCGPASAAGQPCTQSLFPCISHFNSNAGEFNKTRLDPTLFWRDALYVAQIY